MLQARLLCLDNQAHEHAHDYHQLVLSLAGRAEFEVNGAGGEVCRMRACLVPGDADHQFAGMGENRMLILCHVNGAISLLNVQANRLSSLMLSSPALLLLPM